MAALGSIIRYKLCKLKILWQDINQHNSTFQVFIVSWDNGCGWEAIEDIERSQ